MVVVEVILGAFAKVLLDKVGSHAEDHIIRALGFKEDLFSLGESLKTIEAKLSDAEKKQVQEEAVRVWLGRLKDVAYDAENVLDKVSYYRVLQSHVQFRNRVLRKVWYYVPNIRRIAFRLKMANKVVKIRKRLENIGKDETVTNKLVPNPEPSTPTPEETTPYIGSRVVGREDDIKTLVSKLLTHQQDLSVSVITLVGMGGLGKTTLAKSVFNDDQVIEYFDELIWVSVSADFERLGPIMREMAYKITGRKVDFGDVDALVKTLEEELGEKKFFIVLDNIRKVNGLKWIEFKHHLERFSKHKPGSKVLVTTRLQDTADALTSAPDDRIKPKPLSFHNCWDIICGIAFSVPERIAPFEVIGKVIAHNCKGLPLAATILGVTLRNKDRSRWESVRDHGLQYWDENEMIISILKPSVDHLDSSVKQCFAYCSKFPKGYRYDKEQLVQLWMAEGFLPPLSDGLSRVMEDVGNAHFYTLLDHSLFEDVEKDEYDRIRYFKMHDVVHGLACAVSNTAPPRVSLVSGHKDTVPEFPKDRKRKLRTLLSEKDVFRGVSCKSFKSLRVLNLSGSNISVLPDSIGKVKLLRYLDLSGTRILSLPESTCELYLLETLRLQGCRFLRHLPKGLKNLISLRRLYIDADNAKIRNQLLPLQRKRFQRLERLPVFALTGKKGGRIEDLGDAVNLGGELDIYNLEMVGTKTRAEAAALAQKTRVFKLGLRWSSSRPNQDGGPTDNEVIEGLKPHTNVKSILIENFLGTNLASWISLMTSLVEVQLVGCNLSLQIPHLGDLSCLKILRVKGMRSLAHIKPEFYGSNEMQDSFPELKELELSEMENLTDWKEARTGRKVFPSLETLRIHKCPRLETIPTHFPALVNLSIDGVTSPSLLSQLTTKLTTLRSLSIKNISDLRDLPVDLLANNASLSRLVVEACPGLTHISSPLPASLHSLKVMDCGKLESMPSVEGLVSLGFLQISDCGQLTSLPHGLSSCRSLRRITMERCPELNDKLLILKALHERVDDLTLNFGGRGTSIPRELLNFTGLKGLGIGGFSDELNEFPSLAPIGAILKPLEDLRLFGWTKLKSLPVKNVETLTNLKVMTIRGFGKVKALPEWLGKLSSLEEIWIEDCKKLKKFPTKKAMKCLHKLATIFIYRCPKLVQSLKSHTGPEWSKISHLSNIISDSRFPE